MVEENERLSMLPTYFNLQPLQSFTKDQSKGMGSVFEFALPISISISNQIGSHQRVVYCE